jgi:hypothetical protein
MVVSVKYNNKAKLAHVPIQIRLANLHVAQLSLAL